MIEHSVASVYKSRNLALTILMLESGVIFEITVYKNCHGHNPELMPA